MPTSNDDLSKYLPDDATADAATDEAASFDKEISRPELVERLARLKTNPEFIKAAPENATAYVAPTAVPALIEPALPRARVKLAVSAQESPRELPTMPSLKRLESEPAVAVEVGASKASKNTPPKQHASAPRSSVRAGVLAVLSVIVPVLVVILLFVKPPHGSGAKGIENAATSARVAVPATAAEPSAMPAPPPATALPAVTAETSVPLSGVSSAAPEPAPRPSTRSPKPPPPHTKAVITSASAAPAAAPSGTPSVAPLPSAPAPSSWF